MSKVYEIYLFSPNTFFYVLDIPLSISHRMPALGLQIYHLKVIFLALQNGFALEKQTRRKFQV